MSLPIYQEPVLETMRRNGRQKDDGSGSGTVEYFLKELQDKHPAAAKKFWEYLNLNGKDNDTKKYGNNERGNSTWLRTIRGKSHPVSHFEVCPVSCAHACNSVNGFPGYGLLCLPKL